MSPFERLIAALEARGQHVERIGPGLALALCPLCLEQGRRSLMEIRAVPGDDAVRCRGEAAP
jgi:hypothetical protein